MKNLLRFVAGATSVAFFFAGAALAQTSGTITNHAFAIGKGPGVTGFASLLCATTQLPIGQTSADPICRTVTGDVTINASGVTAIGAGKVTNTMIAGMTSAQLAAILSDETGSGAAYFVGGALGTPSSGTLTNATGLPLSGLNTQAAYTFVGNNSGSTAVPTAVDIAALPTKASPALGDYVLLSDQAASGAWKKAAISSVASAGSVVSPLNVENFGFLTTNTGAQNATAWTAILAAATNGNTIIFPSSNYPYTGSMPITKQITLQCGGGASEGSNPTFAYSSGTGDFITINANNVRINGCTVSAPGTPTSNRGVVIGNDYTSLSASCGISSASPTLVCSTAPFVVGDVGKYVRVTGAGAASAGLFSRISAYVNATTVTLSVNASATVAAADAWFGNVYTDVELNGVQVQNFNTPLRTDSTQRFKINNGYFYATGTGGAGCRFNNLLNPDAGDSSVEGTTCRTSDNTTSYAWLYESGGSLKINNSKGLGGLYGFYLNWNQGLSGGPMISNSSFENCASSAIKIDTGVALNDIHFSNLMLTCGSPNVSVSVGSTATLSGGTMQGVNCHGGGGTCLDIGKWSNFNISGNNYNGSGANPAYNIRSTASNGLFSNNNSSGASVGVANASTSVIINDSGPMGFANLPSVAAQGSTVSISNGTLSTNPCTGGGNGALAVRTNSGWACL